jgi:tetratricopeptide (TPR) repeat protein
MKLSLILFITVALFSGCSKMEEKKQNQPETKQPPSNMQNPHTQGNIQEGSQELSGEMMDTAPESAVDEKADKLVKEAKDFEEVYKKSNSEENKKTLIDKNMAAGNYLMYQAKLNPKKKYGPALKLFKRVLELDPNNKEAMNNRMQIEDIYNSMGRDIPK